MPKFEFLASQGLPFESLREHKFPMVVLVGYSNVGKSSLINALAGSRIAHVAKTPGKTRTINSYLVDKKSLLVDLPGFGFAVGDQEEIMQFKQMIREFWNNASGPKFVIHLIDGRRGMRPLDMVAAESMDKGEGTYLRLVGKWDLLNQKERQEVRDLGQPWSSEDKRLKGEVSLKIVRFLESC